MNKPIDTLDDILELLGKFEGVAVTGHYHSSAFIRIRLHIESFSSLYYLTLVAEGTNTRFDTYIFTDNAITIKEHPALALEHCFEIASQENEAVPFEQLYWFAEFLVWKLYRQGGIGKSLANVFLGKWDYDIIK